MTDAENEAESQILSMELDTFLMNTPPGKEVTITDLSESGQTEPQKPTIALHCDNVACKDVMLFDCNTTFGRLEFKKWIPINFLYLCRHCRNTSKWYAFLAIKTGHSIGKAIKVGEFPPFGPHTPARTISLIGPNRNLFLKGRASEARGLGIGAFTYYRRVVENQWKRLIGEIIKVANKLQLDTESLEQAKNESQFSKAVDMVKDAIPQVLLINGHNPMTLLYSALSGGVHELTDEECLERAGAIRVILIDLAERISEALKERKGLMDSLSKLLQSGKPHKDSCDTDSETQKESDSGRI